MNRRENILKAIRFEIPDYVPMTFHINDACWNHYSHDFLHELMETHPFLFPYFSRPVGKKVINYAACAIKDTPFIDDWGYKWETSENGITGTVTAHPLQNWETFNNYTPPSADNCMGLGPVDWTEVTLEMENKKKNDEIAIGGLRHGHTFLQLCDIRGYQNLIYDMADSDPNLDKLVEMVYDFNRQIVDKYTDMNIDIITYAEDLGMQKGPMLSPNNFRKYIKPSYQRLISPAKKKGMLIHMHSDGDLHDLIDDIIDSGVDVINLQDLVNGIDWIANKFGGKTCIDLDIDRQSITVNGTPKEIDELIKQEVVKIGSKQGGLMMIYGLYPGVSEDNVKAIMDAMEKYAFYY